MATSTRLVALLPAAIGPDGSRAMQVAIAMRSMGINRALPVGSSIPGNGHRSLWPQRSSFFTREGQAILELLHLQLHGDAHLALVAA